MWSPGPGAVAGRGAGCTEWSSLARRRPRWLPSPQPPCHSSLLPESYREGGHLLCWVSWLHTLALLPLESGSAHRCPSPLTSRDSRARAAAQLSGGRVGSCCWVPQDLGSWVIKMAWLVFFFRPCHTACGILIPQPGIEPVPLPVEARSPNHWTARECPKLAWVLILISLCIGCLIAHEWVGGWVEGRQEVGIRPKGNSQDVPLPCLALSSGAAPMPTLPEGITGISCL